LSPFKDCTGQLYNNRDRIDRRKFPVFKNDSGRPDESITAGFRCKKNSSGRCDADLQQMVFCVKIERRKTGIQGKMENHYRGERDGGKCKIRGGVIQDSGGTYRKTV
jgi:hypothetical protein